MTAKDEWATVRAGLDSLAWLLNNAHNHDADNWPDLVKAAREDRDRALIALDVLRLQNQALTRDNYRMHLLYEIQPPEKNALERIEELETMLRAWWADPDNPPNGASAYATQETDPE